MTAPNTWPRWIPCAERMPEEGQHVLIAPKYGPVCSSWAKKNARGRLGFYGWIGKTVTHWMPLPPAPGANP